jgi:hypothetical protein
MGCTRTKNYLKKGTFWFSCLKHRMWWPRWFRIIIAHPKSRYWDDACKETEETSCSNAWMAQRVFKKFITSDGYLALVTCGFILATEASWNYCTQKCVSRDLPCWQSPSQLQALRTSYAESIFGRCLLLSILRCADKLQMDEFSHIPNKIRLPYTDVCRHNGLLVVCSEMPSSTLLTKVYQCYAYLLLQSTIPPQGLWSTSTSVA